MLKLVRYLLAIGALYAPVSLVWAADPVCVETGGRKICYSAAADRVTPQTFDLSMRGMCHVATDTGAVTEWTGTAYISSATCPGSAGGTTTTLIDGATATTSTSAAAASNGQGARVIGYATSGTYGATITVYGTNVDCGSSCSAASLGATSVGTITTDGGSVDDSNYLYHFALITAYTSGTISAKVVPTQAVYLWLSGQAVTASNPVPVTGDVTIASGSVTASGTVAAVGEVAQGSIDSGNPVAIGGIAGDVTTRPAAVDAGDRQKLWLGRHGNVVIGGRQNDIGNEVAGALGINGIYYYNLDGAGPAYGPSYAQQMAYGGSGRSIDPVYNNSNYSCLTSAARTASADCSTDPVNPSGSGIVVIVNITARDAATTITPYVRIKDSISGNYFTIWTAASAINSSSGTFAYLLHPGGVSAGSWTEKVQTAIPRNFDIGITHSDANSITYSVSVVLMR